MKTVLFMLVSLSLVACQAELATRLDLSQSSDSGSQNQNFSNRFVLDLGSSPAAPTSDSTKPAKKQRSD